jgi:hypothetical protein
MRPLLRTSLALCAASAVLAACTDQPASAPTGPTVLRAPSFAASPLGNSGVCNVTDLKAYARAYAKKSNDLLVSTVGDIQGLLTKNGGPTVASTDKAFDGLSRVAFIRGTSLQNPSVTGDQFDALVKGFLNCMLPIVYENAAELTGGFGPALGKGWVFEVRGKTAIDTDAGAYERGYTAEWWGAWPNTTTWAGAITSSLTDGAQPEPASIDKRMLIYGYRTSNLAGGQVGGTSFEHRSIPKIINAAGATQFKVAATLGLCFFTTPNTISSSRLNHADKFLTLPTAQPVCDAPVTDFVSAGGYAFGRMNPMRLAKRAAALFAPQPLYAATAFYGGGSVTGSPDDWSPSAVYDLSAFLLKDLGTIADGSLKKPLALTTGGAPTINVKLTADTTKNAADGTPVVMSIAGNSSTIAFFSDNGAQTSATVTRYVKDGKVTFENVKLTKTGGYKLAFQVAFDGVSAFSVVSNSFNMGK